MERLRHKFVEFIPSKLDEKTLYISMKYGTVVHQCVCGCGNKVVTPLTANDWTLTYNGESISLSPSIGNWGFDCRSHYWIKKNKVVWAEDWSEEMVLENRKTDLSNKRIVHKEQRSFLSNLKRFFIHL